MSCRPYQRWIEDEASGALASGVAARLREHLKACGACRQYRERTVSLAHLLARTRAQVPLVDVRDRVMAAIRAGARPAVARAWLGRRTLWQATAASMVLLLLGSLAGMSVMVFSARSVSGGPAAWRLLKRLGATLWSLMGAVGSLFAHFLDLATQAAVSLAPLLPLLEIIALAVLALTFCSAAFPVARILLGVVRPQRSEGR